MKKSTSRKEASKLKKKPARVSKTMCMVLIAAIAGLSIAILLSSSADSSTNVHASNANQKRYRATRPIVVDQRTGQRRMPTQEEINKTVEDLSALTKRSDNLQETPAEPGGITVDLEGGFGGVILARPNADGTWETKCVFTFEEGAEFLGLVEDNTPE